mgnify:CR=1 FL=1
MLKTLSLAGAALAMTASALVPVSAASAQRGEGLHRGQGHEQRRAGGKATTHQEDLLAGQGFGRVVFQLLQQFMLVVAHGVTVAGIAGMSWKKIQEMAKAIQMIKPKMATR